MTIWGAQWAKSLHFMVVLVGGKDLNQGHTSKDRLEQCFGRDSDSNRCPFCLVCCAKCLLYRDEPDTT